MEYTKKHKALIAKLLKNAGMVEDAEFVLSCGEYDYKISNAMRDAARKMKFGMGANPALLDAARRYENRSCPSLKSVLCLNVKIGSGAIFIILVGVMVKLVIFIGI